MKTAKTKPTGANRGNGERILCSLRYLLFKSGRDGDADFVFLAQSDAEFDYGTLASAARA